MGNAPNILCPRCKELFNFKYNLVSCYNKLKDTATELSSKEIFLKIWNSLLNNNENLIYSSTSFLRVTLSHYGKAVGLPATLVALLVPDVNTPPYSHRFKSLIYTKKLVKWIIP